MEPPGLLGRYRDWLRRNIIALNLFETGLSSLTWLLPDRFSKSEVSYEALHTAIGLISTCNESLLSGSYEQDGGSLLLSLSVLQQVQVLVELAALWGERRHGRSRYDALIAYEGVKALLRAYVMAKSKHRILLHGGIGNLDPAALAAAAAGKPSGGRAAEVFEAFVRFRERYCTSDAGNRALPARDGSKDSVSAADMEAVWEEQRASGQEAVPESPPYWWDRPREASKGQATAGGAAHESLVADEGGPEGAGAAAAFANEPPGSGNPASPPRSFGTCSTAEEVAELSAGAQQRALRALRVGEALFIVRPLVYVAALRRWGLRSWRPLALSLAVELASRRVCHTAILRSQRAAALAATSPAVQGTSMAVLYRLQGVRLTAAEFEEMQRRRVFLLYYLLRDPLFARVTRPALGKALGVVDRLPGLSWAGTKLLEILDGMQQLYTYTSAS